MPTDITMALNVSRSAKIICSVFDVSTQTIGPVSCILIMITISRNKILWTLVNCIVYAETVLSLVLNATWPAFHLYNIWSEVQILPLYDKIIAFAASTLLSLKLGFYFSIAAARYSIICGNVSTDKSVKNVTFFVVFAVAYGIIILGLPINFVTHVCPMINSPVCRTILRYWIICMIIGSTITVGTFYIKITQKINISIQAQNTYGAGRKTRSRKDIVTTVSSLLQLTLTLLTFLPYPLYFMSGYKSFNSTPGHTILSTTIFLAATLDPILYLIFSSDFRAAFIRLISICRLSTEIDIRRTSLEQSTLNTQTTTY